MGFFTSLLGLLGPIEALEPEALAAFNALKSFATSQAAKDAEAAIGSLFGHTTTAGVALTVAPKA